MLKIVQIGCFSYTRGERCEELVIGGVFKWGALFFYLSTHSRLEDLSAMLPVILLEFFNVIFILCERKALCLQYVFNLQGNSSMEHIDLE